jgi:hypothetical protein
MKKFIPEKEKIIYCLIKGSKIEVQGRIGKKIFGIYEEVDFNKASHILYLQIFEILRISVRNSMNLWEQFKLEAQYLSDKKLIKAVEKMKHIDYPVIILK